VYQCWQQFLDEVVTQFPDGLTVVPTYGHSARVTDIEAIRTAGRARAGSESVLRVTHAVDVSF